MTPSKKDKPHRTLVAGIGTSAGGLDALKHFFSNMSADTGIAFIVIPHLHPDLPSMMTEILANQTEMPVSECDDGTVIAANHVYVIPPGKDMQIEEGILKLAAHKGPRGQMAIDDFLISLASDQGEGSVAIILSGTGHNGVQGIKAVKAVGGMVLAQTPESADYPQMPTNAITTGHVDYAQTPEQLAETLSQYAQHSHLSAMPGARATLNNEAAEHLNSILSLMRARSKYDFRFYRKNMLMRRVQRRMGMCHISDLEDYLQYLRENSDEITLLYKDMLIGVTSFFRDPEAFQVLAQRVLPELVARCDSDNPIRVWVSGCSTGEEAYSVAMLLTEQFLSQTKLPNIQIFGTDIDEDALEVARQGIYPASIDQEVSQERLAHFFVKTDDHHYQINKQIRETIVFAPQNLICDAPFSRLDLVCCRNLLIYIEPHVQHKVISLFHFALKEDGYMFLGPSETISNAADLFEPLSKKWRTFRRVGPTRRDLVNIPIVSSEARRSRATYFNPSSPHSSFNFAELMQNTLLADFTPASVLINRKYEILSYHGATVNFLAFPSGEPTQDLISLARQGLRTKIRSACHNAVATNQTVIEADVCVKRDDRYINCCITVTPYSEPKEAEGLMLVTFTETPEKPPTAQLPTSHTDSESSVLINSNLVQQLEYELKATREDLQSTIEELEGSNEELKASNEEVMSMNEEFQSANEELETSKEELQSLNEELSTVNNQLQEKVSELDKSNDDLTNLFNSTDIASLFLDTDFRIQRFTPAISTLLNLKTSDTGRPVTDISSNFDDQTLLEQCRQVLDKLTPLEKELLAHNQHWYLRRITPYRTSDNRIDGVVIAFINITERKIYEESLEKNLNETCLQLDTLESLVAGVGSAVIISNREGTYLQFNTAAESLFGKVKSDCPPTDWPQQYGLYLPDGCTLFPWHQLPLVKAMQGEQSEETEIFVRSAQHPSGASLLCLAAPLRIKNGEIRGAVAVYQDITERKEIYQRLYDKTAPLSAIMNGVGDAIVLINQQGTITELNLAAENIFGYSAAEVLGKNVNLLMPPLAPDNDIKHYLDTRQSSVAGASQEFQGLRKDGSHFPLELTLTEIESLGKFCGIVRDLTIRKALEKEVAEISAMEQSSIGQEIHDGLGQQLTALSMLARKLSYKCHQQELPEADTVDDVVELLNQASNSARLISHGLTPPMFEEGLEHALRNLAEETKSVTGIHCQWKCDPNIKLDDYSQCVQLYRIAQESLNNALKYSEASNIQIELKYENNDVVLSIRDNGVGFDPHLYESGSRHDGNLPTTLGLRLMNYRAHTIDGKLSIISAPKQGTEIRCHLRKSSIKTPRS